MYRYDEFDREFVFARVERKQGGAPGCSRTKRFSKQRVGLK